MVKLDEDLRVAKFINRGTYRQKTRQSAVSALHSDTIGHSDEHRPRQTDKRRDRPTHKRMDGQTDRRTGKRMDGCTQKHSPLVNTQSILT